MKDERGASRATEKPARCAGWESCHIHMLPGAYAERSGVSGFADRTGCNGADQSDDDNSRHTTASARLAAWRQLE
jgi:hypothetical protein